MRTTVDIPDALLAEAKARALADGTTLRTVVTDALRATLGEAPQPAGAGVEVPVYGGSGLAPGVSEAELFSREERKLADTWPGPPSPAG